MVLVQKSSTCVILVVDDKIRFVSTEGNAPKELARCRNYIKGKNMEIVKTTFEPLSTTDVVEKLAKIGKKRDTFLVRYYFPNCVHNCKVLYSNFMSLTGIFHSSQ